MGLVVANLLLLGLTSWAYRNAAGCGRWRRGSRNFYCWMVPGYPVSTPALGRVRRACAGCLSRCVT